MANPPARVPGTPAETDPLAAELEMKLRGVDGGVKASMVGKLRQMVEKNPQAVMQSMRGWLAHPEEH
jgi:hypothetical protein